MPDAQARPQEPANDEDIEARYLSGVVGFWLRQASNAMSADFARHMEGTGMRPVLVAILSVIDENPGLNQGQLGRALGVQRANMVSLVGTLAERGLVDRRDAPGDRRAFALHLTRKGEKMLAECRGRIAAHEEHMLEPLSIRERAQLLDLLKKVETRGR